MSEVVTRLDGLLKKNGGQFERIGGAMDFARLAKQPTTPCAYVIPQQETGSANRLSNGHSQLITERFLIVVGLSVKNNLSGADAETAAKTLRQAVKDKVLGWQPTEYHEPIEFDRGRLLDVTAGKLWWQDEFHTAIEERG